MGVIGLELAGSRQQLPGQSSPTPPPLLTTRGVVDHISARDCAFPRSSGPPGGSKSLFPTRSESRGPLDFQEGPWCRVFSSSLRVSPFLRAVPIFASTVSIYSNCDLVSSFPISSISICSNILENSTRL